MKRNILIILFFAAACCAANAQDRVFTHTYQSNILPLGIRELEYWGTLRSGKNQFYNAIDHRLELEFGLGKSWQTAFYLNLSSETYYQRILVDANLGIYAPSLQTN